MAFAQIRSSKADDQFLSARSEEEPVSMLERRSFLGAYLGSLKQLDEKSGGQR